MRRCSREIVYLLYMFSLVRFSYGIMICRHSEQRYTDVTYRTFKNKIMYLHADDEADAQINVSELIMRGFN